MTEMHEPSSLQVIGSKAMGGAEYWFVRFSKALAARRMPAELAIRSGSALDGMDLGGLPVHPLPFRTVWDPLSRAALARLIRHRRPDVVQTYMGRATRLTRLTAGRGPVHIARLGGYYKLNPYRHAHAWIGNTKGLCDWMIANGLRADRVHHIYNFADEPEPVNAMVLSQIRSTMGLPDDAWILLALGRLIPVKGHADLLHAMSLLPATIAGRPVRLILLGDGPLGPELVALAQRLGIAERVTWAGWQDHRNPYMTLADLVVFPSHEEETLGNVILEAWAWSKPLLTASFRGAREIARDQSDAWCVPCADPAALAAGIRGLLSDDASRLEIAAAGHRRIDREFSRDAILDQYQDLYRRLTGA